jgi:hypothetical protein
LLGELQINLFMLITKSFMFVFIIPGMLRGSGFQ